MATTEENLYGLGDPVILGKIDKLFACGVGDHINLPQIVVVGDQSSGKSSVLEGLIRKPLPRDSGLCTRFATQIVFKRDTTETISVSIIPGPDATEEHKLKLNAWSKRDVDTLDAATFTAIMSEVHEIMGLSQHKEGSARVGSTFSRDVLRLELCGPSQEHLSVIDVPGLFKNSTPGVTTKDDISLVREMVVRYMENPRSVMLAVIPANVDVATQEILEMAAGVDPNGDRTLGVLPKPDLVDQGAEPRVIDLLEGRAHPLKLGWHVVRNPGQQHLSDLLLDRNSLEQNFFDTKSPWNKVDKDRVGVESLRVRIQAVLTDLVRQEFPKVKYDVTQKLDSARQKLKKRGRERDSTETQRLYLMELSTRFQHLVSLSIDAKYGTDTIFDDKNLRLATLISGRNGTFSEDISRYGQTYPFTTTKAQGSDDDLPPALTWETADTDLFGPGKPVFGKVTVPGKIPLPEKTVVETRKVTACEILDDIVHTKESLPITNSESIASWLKMVYKDSRGFELGTFDSSVLGTTMKEQTLKWEALTLGYISDIVAIVHRFIESVLNSICPDKLVRSELMSILTGDLLDRYSTAIERTRFLLDVERTGTPMTLNHYFNDNLEKCRGKRMQAWMAEKAVHDTENGLVVKVNDITHTHPMSNTEHVIQDLHDILYSYYKVARKRFVDNVCMQATDHFLINGPKTPLILFSPTFVSSLSVEQLNGIAGEDQATRRTRARLNKEIVSLEEAKVILR